MVGPHGLALPQDSRNSFGNKQARADLTFRKIPRKYAGSAETPSGNSGNLPAVASQLAAGEEFLPQNGQIWSKSMIFCVPHRFVGSGTETAIELFGYDPTSKKMRSPYGLCGTFLCVYVWKFPEIFPEIC